MCVCVLGREVVVVYWRLDILDATEEIYIVESEIPIGEGK